MSPRILGGQTRITRNSVRRGSHRGVSNNLTPVNGSLAAAFRFDGEQRALVVDREPRGKPVSLEERILELGHGNACCISLVLGGLAAEEPAEPVVKGDEVLCDLLALHLVRRQYAAGRDTLDGSCHLPRQVVRVLHGGVHALTRLGRVSMARISCDKHTIVQGESVRRTLPDHVRCPPVQIALANVERVRRDDRLGRGEDHLGRDAVSVHAAVEFRDLDVESHQPVFARNDHHAARVDRVDCTPIAHVREVGDGHSIEYAPDERGLVALHLAAHLTPCPGVCAVAPDHVLGMDAFAIARPNHARRCIVWSE